MKKPILLCIVNMLLFSVSLLLLESGLSYLGYTPYPMGTRPDIRVKPNGTYFQVDSMLGYKHLMGEFEVCLKKKLCFSSKHATNSLRLTHISRVEAPHEKPQLWMFGCSFTYGWSINDEETFPWLLQARLKEWEVVNWGVNGYGTIHFYLQLKAALERGEQPKMIVINHAHFHHERNFFSYNHRLSVSRWNFLGRLNQPYACLNSDEDLEIKHSEVEYAVWSLSRKSTLVYFIQRCFENFKDSRMHKDSRKITQMLFDRIADLCDENGVKLLVSNIAGPPQFIEEYCEQKQIPFIDISLDLTQNQYTNAPYDRHPNAKANLLFANRLYQVIDEMGH